MKYQTPELTALKPAIDAIQTIAAQKPFYSGTDGPESRENVGAYEDWE